MGGKFREAGGRALRRLRFGGCVGDVLAGEADALIRKTVGEAGYLVGDLLRLGLQDRLDHGDIIEVAPAPIKVPVTPSLEVRNAATMEAKLAAATWCGSTNLWFFSSSLIVRPILTSPYETA